MLGEEWMKEETDGWRDRVTGYGRNGGEYERRDRIRADGWGERVERNIGTGLWRNGRVV